MFTSIFGYGHGSGTLELRITIRQKLRIRIRQMLRIRIHNTGKLINAQDLIFYSAGTGII
jgi:hypothetical protein